MSQLKRNAGLHVFFALVLGVTIILASSSGPSHAAAVGKPVLSAQVLAQLNPVPSPQSLCVNNSTYGTVQDDEFTQDTVVNSQDDA
jgi:hypothetical protein